MTSYGDHVHGASQLVTPNWYAMQLPRLYTQFAQTTSIPNFATNTTANGAGGGYRAISAEAMAARPAHA